MLMFIGLIVVSYMFYTSAKKADRNGIFWILSGVVLWFVLGLLFLTLSDKYILNITTFEEAISLRWQKLLLEGVSAFIIIIISYLIQERFIKARKRI